MPDDEEWMVDEIVGRRFNGRSIKFNVQWTTGDHTWEPYAHVKDLEALDHYYALMGVTRWQQLGCRNNDPEGDPLVDPPAANPCRTTTARRRVRN